MKAADITDTEIYVLVAGGVRSLFAIQDHFARTRGIPEKVTKAKLAQMVNKKRLDGCACGCNGDFAMRTVTE